MDRKKIEEHLDNIVFEMKKIDEIFFKDGNDSIQKQKFWKMKKSIEKFCEVIGE